MALQVSYTDDYGATHAQAYVQVQSMTIYPSVVHMDVAYFHNAAARSKADETAQKSVIRHFQFQIAGTDFNTYFADGVLDDDTKSPFKQAYAYLKTQSEPIDLRSATDV